MVMKNSAALEAIAPVATYSGATVSAVFWGLSISDLGIIISTTVAVLGFLAHIWLSIRRERRAIERHAATLETLNPRIPRDE